MTNEENANALQVGCDGCKYLRGRAQIKSASTCDIYLMTFVRRNCPYPERPQYVPLKPTVEKPKKRGRKTKEKDGDLDEERTE
jgi:hypothetical protein